MKVKIHESYRKIVALADSDIIGKTFEEGIRQIEVRANFFDGEEKSYEEVLLLLKDFDMEDATFNIVGEESVRVALEAGIIKSHGIIHIDKVPVALGLM